MLAISYNGVASSLPHCNERRHPRKPSAFSDPQGYLPHACKGWDQPPGQDRCEAVHAEQNALVQCADPDKIWTACVTLSPCLPCAKLLLNTTCGRIVYQVQHPAVTSAEAEALWRKAGREWLWLPVPSLVQSLPGCKDVS